MLICDAHFKSGLSPVITLKSDRLLTCLVMELKLLNIHHTSEVSHKILLQGDNLHLQ